MTPSALAPSAAMTIGGSAAESGSTFPVVNPATEEDIAHVPECSREQLDAAMCHAQEALPAWGRDDAERCRVLGAAADLIETEAPRLAALLTAEQGKPLAEAGREIAACARWLRYFAELRTERETIDGGDSFQIEILRPPVGVVAAITPWNFPVLLAVWKIAPALRAGCTVVLKPSPFTPLTALELGRLLAPLLPPGALNVVSGGDDLGAAMTTHPIPRKVSFTGSVAAGRQVGQAAAGGLKRMTLELGGNDPALVLDDADPEAVADSLFWGAFMNNGQICSAIKRVYAPQSKYDAIVKALAERARAATVGEGTDPDTQLGPLTNEPQLDRVAGLVDQAVERGALAVSGGARIERPGYFFSPTILACQDDELPVVAEEQFGPALPIVAYRSEDEAIRRANATEFGLSGSVWSADPERGRAVAAQLECGTAWVNAHLALAPYQPFAGVKSSGIGVENGILGLHEFTDVRVVHGPAPVA